MSCETRIVRGRRILVVKPRRFGSAARNMAARGWPAFRICAALRMKRGRLAKELSAANGSIWGAFAAVLADEMRRAG